MKHLAIATMAMIAVTGAAVSAQVPSVAPTTQATVDPERYVDSLLRAKPGTARPLQPLPAELTPAEPSRKSKAAPPPIATLAMKRDGDMASDRIGYLQPTPDGTAWQYAFESAGEGMTDPPMLLIPNSRLAAMEQARQAAESPLRLKVTGLITSYRGQNYLLVENVRAWPRPAAMGPASREAGLPATQSVEPVALPTTEPAATSATQPIDPELALEQLLRPRPRMANPLEAPIANDAPKAAEGVAPAIPEIAPVREGEMVAQRIGRLQRAANGPSKFIFESDDRVLVDPPMIMAPNQKLAQMEDALARAGVDLRFRVTGLITTYLGQNYLLVEKSQLVTDHEGL